jgi:hypothetical protein
MIAPAVNSPTLLWNSLQTADALGVSTRQLARLTVPHGDLPALRIGTGPRRLLRYRVADVEAWIDRHVEAATHDLVPQIAEGDGITLIEARRSSPHEITSLATDKRAG